MLRANEIVHNLFLCVPVCTTTCAGEDITAAKAAIHSMSHDLPLVAEQMSARLGNIQDKLARLISSSQDYGKLKVSSPLTGSLFLSHWLHF